MELYRGVHTCASSAPPWRFTSRFGVEGGKWIKLGAAFFRLSSLISGFGGVGAKNRAVLPGLSTRLSWGWWRMLTEGMEGGLEVGGGPCTEMECVCLVLPCALRP